MIILPFLLLIFVTLSFMFVSFFALRRINRGGRKKVYTRFLIYIGVIFIMMIVITFFPKKSTLKETTVTEIKEFPDIIHYFHDDWDEKAVADLKVNTETFTLTNDVLYIDVIDDENNNIYVDIVAEQVDELRDSIEVILYKSPGVFDKYDITDDYPNYLFIFNEHENRLTIDPNIRSVVYGYFKAPFSVNMFSNKNTPMFDEPFQRSEQVVHIKLGKNVKIVSEDEDSIYIQHKYLH